MSQPAHRLRDALGSIRRRYGMETDLDRIIGFLVFNKVLTEEQLNDLFIAYPTRVPEDFKSALLARIQKIIRQYWNYQRDKTGYHKIIRGVRFLENVARHGFGGCRLRPDKLVGYRLELKATT